ncbi:CHAD domain-containing protein [Actinoalloteichus hymeniacidonis]|uniref:CHAD domain-containing protein n=1 Tax=Actinoalloteichus hymeniacidonis TaxID=340345 RepID=A0AAC9HMV5_9PSEU|nr:CHAD domain-containing protein [Actinoalloteichus hymeniacidonis]AOS62254.1 hypothetical protein TL08_07175 [Actinoalloteichus hymeniacidonis]MBB5909720.1 CHAD domain-containing protein [Actinoalloteichus hymeniacidonis]
MTTETPQVSPSTTRIDKKSSAGEVVLAYLHEQAAALRSWEDAFRRGEPDAVHRMRIAVRRMRSALQAFGEVVDREQTRGLTSELRWLAEVLGESRDVEVVYALLKERTERTPPELLLGAVDQHITRDLARRQADSDQAVSEALDGPRHRELTESIAGLLAQPPLTPLAAERARTVLPASVARTYRKLDRAARAVGAPPWDRASIALDDADTDQDQRLHETRKLAKRMRYAVEVVRPITGKKVRRLGRAVRRLQRTLGTRQDIVLTRQALRRLGAQATATGGNGFTFGLWYGHDHGRAAALEQRFAEDWRRVTRSRSARWTG